MHIVYVTSEFVTEKEYGGLAVYLNNISNIMSRHGHKVTIVTLSECEGELLYKKDIDVIRVKRTPLEPLKDDLYAAISMLENSWKLFSVLKKVKKSRRVDLVQSANYQAVGFFRDYQVPTIVRVSSDS